MAQVYVPKNKEDMDFLFLVALLIVKTSSILHEITPLVEIILKYRRNRHRH